MLINYILKKFIFINGIFDLLMVFLHLTINWSWWSQFNIKTDYLYFAFLYGYIRVFENNNLNLIFISYLIETIYYINNYMFCTAYLCNFINLLILLLYEK